MRTTRIIVAVAAILFGAYSQAHADFVLTGTQHLDVTGAHVTGVLYDASTANVLLGGQITSLDLHDFGTAAVSGGGLVSQLYALDTSNVTVTGGVIERLLAELRSSGGAHISVTEGEVTSFTPSITLQGTENLDISGGPTAAALAPYGLAVSGGHVGFSQGWQGIELEDASTVTVSGGTFYGLATHGSSMATIGGGTFEVLSARQSSVMTISGGTISMLDASDTGTVSIDGGRIGTLEARQGSRIELTARDVQSLQGLTLEPVTVDGVFMYEVTGTGQLTGKWLDGTAWTMGVLQEGNATILVPVPEPATLSLLALGGLAILRRRRNRR